MRKLVIVDASRFPGRLQLWRKRAGMSQRELGQRMGVSEPVAATNLISRWERGIHTPSIEKMKKAARILGVTLDDLIAPR